MATNKHQPFQDYDPENNDLQSASRITASSEKSLSSRKLKSCSKVKVFCIFVLLLIVAGIIAMIIIRQRLQAEAYLNEIKEGWNHHVVAVRDDTRNARDKYLTDILNLTVTTNKRSETLLMGITCPALAFQRRQLMRAYQIDRYKAYDFITWKFFLPNPPELYREALRVENATYGDLVILENVPEGLEAAYTIKVFEWFRYVEANMPMYRYVGRMDTDLFLNIPQFEKYYMTEEVQKFDNLTFIAQWVKDEGLDWPQGALEILSWKMMLLMTRFYENADLIMPLEDVAMAWYLMLAEIDFTEISIDNDHLINDFSKIWNTTNETVKVHDIKSDEQYIITANSFDEKGFNKAKFDALMQKYQLHP